MITITPTQAHAFAFYTTQVTSIVRSGQRRDIHTITDAELVHRLIVVLRFDKGDTCILFDRFHHITCMVLGVVPKKSITIEILSLDVNKQLTPSITWLLPILKREAFEEAVYACTELGAQEIQLIITDKAQRAWGGEKEMARLEKITIAAAEQSKHFSFPIIKPAISLPQALENYAYTNNTKIFFDASGTTCREVINKLSNTKPLSIIALNGPEGDLTMHEKELLRQQQFIFCALTPTILRSQQAVTVGLAILRSFLT